MPSSFSPDGKHVLASEVVDANAASRFFVVSAADGTVELGTGANPPLLGFSAAWGETDTIVLSRNVAGTVNIATRNDLQECTIDGTCRELAPELRLPDTQSPRYVVGTRAG